MAQQFNFNADAQVICQVFYRSYNVMGLLGSSSSSNMQDETSSIMGNSLYQDTPRRLPSVDRRKRKFRMRRRKLFPVKADEFTSSANVPFPVPNVETTDIPDSDDLIEAITEQELASFLEYMIHDPATQYALEPHNQPEFAAHIPYEQQYDNTQRTIGYPTMDANYVMNDLNYITPGTVYYEANNDVDTVEESLDYIDGCTIEELLDHIDMDTIEESCDYIDVAQC